MRCAGLATLVLLLFLAVLFPEPSLARYRLLGDWQYTFSESRAEEEETEEETETTSHVFSQIYRLDINRQIYPLLQVNFGGLFQRNDVESESNGLETDLTGEVFRPYVDAELRSTLYSLLGGYSEIEIEDRFGDGATRRLTGRDYHLRGEWRPVGYPELAASYIRILREDDEEPRTIDSLTENYLFSARYDYRRFRFHYQFMATEEEQETTDRQTSTATHSGRMEYARPLFGGRGSFNTRVQLERATVEFSGGGDRLLRTVPLGTGFYRLQDLTPEISLPDDYTEIPPGSFAEVDLGSGGGRGPVSFGLAFGDPTTVDELRILLPSDLDQLKRQEIDRMEGEWRWQVFVSDDQLDWTPRPVLGADYDPLDNQFRIRFARTAAVEFIKVVTTPVERNPRTLAPVGSIPVSDLQAFVILPPEQGDEIVSTSRILNSGVAWNPTARTRVGYDLAYQDQEVDAFDSERRLLSNGIYLSHIFNDTFTGSARGQRSDRWQDDRKDSTIHGLTLQLLGRYLPTLSQTYMYTGQQTDDRDGESWRHSFLLRTTAELYRGWDTAFEQGYSRETHDEFGDSSTVFIRLSNTIVPHPSMSLLAEYNVRWTKESGRPDSQNQSARLHGFWTPAAGLSLVGEIGHRQGEETSITEWEYGINWLPLRDGALQMNVTYAEEGDSEEERLRSLSPSLIWRITQSAFLNLSYTKGTRRDRFGETDFQLAQANFRLYFD